MVGVNDIIIYVMLAFMAFAVVDKLFLKDKFGYGKKFDEAFHAMGPLALTIVGIMCLAPTLGSLLTPVFAPIYKLIGADPAMISGTLLASDMGGFAIASEMTADYNIQMLSGILLGSMVGVTIIFVIPYSSSVVEASDKPFLCKGIMAGIIPAPIGCLIGGLVGGIPFTVLLINLLPVTLFVIILALLLWRAPKILTKIFEWFSKILTAVFIIALALAIVEYFVGLAFGGFSFIGVFNGWTGLSVGEFAPIGPQLETVGLIAIMLAGAYPFIHFLTTVLTKPLNKLGSLIGVNSPAAAGMLASLASAIPMYPMIKDMNKRGKVIAVAFSVCAGFTLGDFLGFTSSVAPGFILAMIVGKLSAGIIAAVLAWLLTRKTAREEKAEAAAAEQTAPAAPQESVTDPV